MTSTTNRTSLLVAGTAAVLTAGIVVAATAGSGSAARAATPEAGTVTVSGTGSVNGVPDTLTADFSVRARSGSVQTALNDSASDARKVIASLRAHGVAAKDIQTADVELDPYYKHGSIAGYESSESISARIHPLTHVGRILSAAATSAGNSVSVDDLSFDIANNAALLAAARANAFANAKTAATQYAQLSDQSLGSVVSVSAVVDNASPVDVGSYAKATSAGAGAAVPISAGQQQVSVDVKVVWSLS